VKRILNSNSNSKVQHSQFAKMWREFIETHLNIFGEKNKLICTRISKKHPRFLGRKPNFFSPEFQENFNKSIHVSWGEKQTSFHRNFKKSITPFCYRRCYVSCRKLWSAPPLTDTPGIFMHKNFKKSVSKVVVIDVVVKCDPLHFNGSHIFWDKGALAWNLYVILK